VDWKEFREAHPGFELPENPDSYHTHPHGGGWVSNNSKVSADSYIGEDSIVTHGSQVAGGRIDDGCYVSSSRVVDSQISGSKLFGSVAFGCLPIDESKIRGSKVFGSRVFGSQVTGSKVVGSRINGSEVTDGAYVGAHSDIDGSRISGAVDPGAEI
jgi:hypothetical protein